MPRRPRLMTTEQTADYLTGLGVRTSARTLEDWRHKDTGPDYLRIQGRVRYKAEAIREWLGQGERKPAGTAA